MCVCVLYTHATPIISQITDREDGGGGRPQGKVGGKLGSYLEDSSPIHTSSCWVLVCSGDSPGSPGLRVGGGRVSPAPRPSLPWRHEQATEGSHRLSRTSLWAGSLAAGSALESSRGEADHQGCLLASLCLGSLVFWAPLPAISLRPPAPLGQGGPGCPVPLPCRNSKDERICLSVCPADYLSRLPVPSPFSKPGSLGSPVPIPNPLFWIKAASAVWGPRGRRGSPACPG